MDLAPFPGSGGSTGWRLILGIGAVPALIAVVLRSRMPESPRWLMRHGKYEEMRDALGILGVSASTDEIRDTARHLEAADARSEGKGLSRWTPGIKRALIVVCVFFVFQQITGINVPLYYGPKLLGSLFQSGGSQVASTVAGVEVTAIMTAVNVAATFIAFKLIDRAGRRKLAMSGYAGMLLSAVLAGAGLGLLAGTAKIVVVAIALDAFIASFAAGVGGTGWVLQGRSSPPGSPASALAGC